MCSIAAYSSALVALASALAVALGTGPAIPIALSALAATGALVAGLRSGSKVQETSVPPQAITVAEPAPSAPEPPAAPAIVVTPAPEPADKADSAAMALSLLELRYADAVLCKVSAETESAAFALMERLIALRNQSEKASKLAASADGDLATSTTISSLADNAKATISRVRTALADMRKHDKTAATGLQALGKELTAGMELLAEIGEITERSRLIAFNMAIEAARIGSQGNGFKVIVGELRNLNDQTAVFSKRVSELLGRFKKFNESLVEKSVKDSAFVAEAVERGIEDEEKAKESLLAISHACVDLSGAIEQVVASMNRDLDGILESLQFQDITRQMVEGVQFMVSEVRSEMSRRLQPSDGSPVIKPDQAHSTELRSRLLSLAHTRAEKEAIQEVII